MATSLGNLTIYLDADITKLTTKLKQLNISVQDFGKVVSAEAAKRNASAQKSSSIQESAMKKTKNGWGKLVKTTQMSGSKIGSVQEKMIYDTKQSFGHMMHSMLNFQAFLGKIIHYITFSIGVQMVMGIKQGITKAIDVLKEYEGALYETASVAGYLGESFDGAVKSLENFSRAVVKGTIFTATDAIKAMYDFASAGYDVVAMAEDGKRGMESFTAVIEYATATHSDLTEATQALVTTLKQFNLELTDLPEIVDTYTTLVTSSFLTQEKLSEAMKYAGTIAGVLGQSYRDTAAAAAVLANRGMEGSQVGQRLNMIMTKLINPTEKAKGALARLGITLNDINPEAHSMLDIMYKLQAANFGTAEATQMFRARTAASAIALVNAADEYSDYIKMIKMNIGITTSMAEKQGESFEGSMAQFNQAIHDATIEFGKSLKPILLFITSLITGKVIPAISWLATALSGYVPILKALGVLLAGYIAYHITAVIWGKLMAVTLITEAIAAKGLATSLILLGKGFLLLSARAIVFVGIAMAIMNLVENGPNLINVLSIALMGLGVTIVAVSAMIHAAAGPVGWAIAAIGALVAIISTMSESEKEEAESVKTVRNILIMLNDEYGRSDSIVNLYNKSVQNLTVSLQDEAVILENVYDLQRKGLTDTQAYTDANIKLAKVAKEIAEGEDEVIQLSSKYLNVLKSTDSRVSTTVDTYKRYRTAEENLADAKERIIKLGVDEKKLYNEMNDIQQIYGTNSQEYVSISNQYNATVDRLNSTVTEKNRLTDESVALEGNYKTSLNDSTGAIHENIEAAIDLYDARLDLINLLDQRTKLLNDLTQLERTEAQWETYLAEGAHLLLEEKEKLFEIELKQYKLGKDRTDQLDELFDALAEEGMLTDDIIEGYKDKKISEGEAIKAGVEFAGVLNNLTDEGRDLVTDWLEVYIKALMDGEDEATAMKKANDKIPGTLGDIVGEGTSAYNTVLKYGTSVYEARDAIRSFDSTITTFSADLYENGLATGEVADTYGAIVKSTMNAELSVYEYQEALNNLVTDGIQPVIETAAAMWIALGGFPEGRFQEYDEKEMKQTVAEISQKWSTAVSKGLIEPDYTEDGKITWIFPDVITEDLLRTMEYSEDEIESFRLVGDDFIDKSSIQEAKEAFKNSLWELNKETGYFGNKTDDAATVLQNFINYVQKHGGPGVDIYSSATATAAISMKALVDMGMDESKVLAIIGGDFDDVRGRGTTALLDITNDAQTAGLKLDDVNLKLKDTADLLEDLMDKTFVTNLLINVEAQVKEESMDRTQWVSDNPWDNLRRGLDRRVGGKDPPKGKDWYDLFGKDEDLSLYPGTWWDAKGAIHGLQKGASITKGPQFAMIGEAGPEAVIPLAGQNKKYGIELLRKIIPQYFPNMAFAQGGILGGGGGVIGGAIAGAMQGAVLTSLFKGLYQAADFIMIAAMILLGNVLLGTAMLVGGIANVTENFEKIGIEKFEEAFTSISDLLKETYNTVSKIQVANARMASTMFLSGVTMASQLLKVTIMRLIITLNTATNDLKSGMNIAISSFDTGVKRAALSFSTGILAATVRLQNSIIYAAITFSNMIKSIPPIRVIHEYIRSNYNYHYYYTVGGAAKGGLVKGEQMITVGEKGPEAIIPLTGSNKKFGEKLLNYIIPEYYPELIGKAQGGGIFGGVGGNTTYGGDTNNIEEYNILGPISVTGVQDTKGFMDDLRFRARATGAKR